ncbi:MAG: hypothetical protein R3E01_23115 [Pirellulaceae bacterium]|nr:hypothetical protein [Planctomycetales bacterium]
MSEDPLTVYLNAVRRLAQREWYTRLAIRGGCVALLIAGLAIFVDYLFRWQDWRIRALAAASVLVCAAISWRRSARNLPRDAWSDVTVAQHIDQHYPQLESLISSGVAFRDLSSSSDTGSSRALSDSVVATAEKAVASFEPRDVIHYESGMRLKVLATAAVVIFLTVAALYPRHVRAGVTRLLMPWANVTWPQTVSLQFDQAPTLAAVGAEVEFVVSAAEGTLPDRVELLYEETGQNQSRQNQSPVLQRRPMIVDHGKARFRLANVTDEVRYRAVAGDDQQMEWRNLRLFPPLRLDKLQFEVVPPEYTGLRPTPVQPRMQVLAGSALRASGIANRDLAKVQLQIQSGSDTVIADGTIDGDRRERFQFPADVAGGWRMELSGVYGWILHDVHGLSETFPTKYHINIVEDQIPTVDFTHPQPDMWVAPSSVVVFQGSATDDICVTSIELRVGRDVDVYNVTVELAGGTLLETADGVAPSRVGVASLLVREVVEFETPFDLSSYADVDAGVTLFVVAAVRDCKGQEGSSILRRLHVVSPEELLARYSQRQSLIMSQVADTLRQQKRTLNDTKAALDGWQSTDRTSHVDRQVIDQLQSIEQQQRHVREVLTVGEESAVSKLHGLAIEMQQSRIDTGNLHGEVSRVAQQLTTTLADEFAVAESQLLNAIKGAEGVAAFVPPTSRKTEQVAGTSANADTADDTADVIGFLVDATATQWNIIASMEQLLGDLAHWEGFRQIGRELYDLKSRQEELAETTRILCGKTTSKRVRDLAESERNELSQIVEDQKELARHYDRVMANLCQNVQRSDFARDGSRQHVDNAVRLAESLGISSQMRDAGAHAEQNQLNEAVRDQLAAVQALHDLIDAVARPDDARRTLVPRVDDLRLIEGMAERQRRIYETAVNVEAERTANGGGATSVQIASIEQLVVQQRALIREVERLMPIVQALPVRMWTLSHAQLNMESAAVRLASFDTGPLAQEPLLEAADQLEMLQHSLAPVDGLEGLTSAERGEQRAFSSREAPPPGGAGAESELRLVVNLQSHLRHRTMRWQRTHADDSASSEALRERNELAQIQRELASMLQMLFETRDDVTQQRGGAISTEGSLDEPLDKSDATRATDEMSAQALDRSLDEALENAPEDLRDETDAETHVDVRDTPANVRVEREGRK